MATNTYVALDKVTVTSSVTSITLNMGSTLSQAYTDLVLVANTIVPTGNTFPECSLRFNGDTGSNYSSTYLLGLGSGSGVSGRASNITYADCGYLTSNSGNPNTRIINIMNYSNTTTNKTVLVRGSSDNAGQVIAYANLWRNTAAITSITVFTQGGTYASGSTFSLYGISNAGDATPKATGGNVTSDATYWYHSFTMSGNFVPNQSVSCDILQIAGGGGGGGNIGAGGGAGGLLAFTSQSLTATSYSVLVGGGGALGGSAVKGSSGTNSRFGSLTASVGGGGGGSRDGGAGAGLNGGSGGGGSEGSAGGTGTSGQGNAGGSSAGFNSGPNFPAGGGGGAGAAGAAPTSVSGTGGNGGNGVNTYSAWATATSTGVSGYYAGGGAGGSGSLVAAATGGLGGGGTGSTPGAVNTGSGGAGNTYFAGGGAGGSGLVIVRYAK